MLETTNTPDLSNETDEALVLRTLSSEKAAYAVLVSRYYGQVYAIAYARLREHEASEELAQDAFIRAFLHLERLAEPRLFSHWLCRIARNIAINWLRDRRRRSEVIGMIPLHTLPEEPPDEKAGPRERASQAQLNTWMDQALNTLPTELREAVLLYYFEGVSKAQIAELHGVKASTLGRRIDQAIDILRHQAATLTLQEIKIRWKSRKSGTRKAAALILAVTQLPEHARTAILAATSDTVNLASLTGAHGNTGGKAPDQVPYLASPNLALIGISVLTLLLLLGGILLRHQNASSPEHGVQAYEQRSTTSNMRRARLTSAKSTSSDSANHAPNVVATKIDADAVGLDSTSTGLAAKGGALESAGAAAVFSTQPQSNSSINSIQGPAPTLFTISGRITDEQGKPLANTQVWCHVHNRTGDFDFAGTVSGHGEYRAPCLAAGDTFVVVNATATYQGAILSIVSDDMMRDNPLIRNNLDNFTHKDITLVRAGRSSISGRVVEEDTGWPVSNAWVVAVRVNRAAYAKAVRETTGALENRGQTFELVSLANDKASAKGLFKIARLPEGDYFLRAVAHPYWQVVDGVDFKHSFALKEGESTGGLQAVLRRGRALEGYVRDADTTLGLDGVQVGLGRNLPFLPVGFNGPYLVPDLSWSDMGASIVIDQPVQSDAQGHYLLDGVPWGYVRIPSLHLDGYEPVSVSDGSEKPSPLYFLKSSAPPARKRPEEAYDLTYRHSPAKLKVDFGFARKAATRDSR